MDLQYKKVGFQLEELKARGDDGWSFSGYASTFGNVDLGGDIVLKGAFHQSLKDRRPQLLWQHDMGETIGVVTSLKEDDRGLFGEFKLSKTRRGADAYHLLKDGALNSLSIGYIPTDSDFEDDGIRKLKAVDLLEISVVSMPMNEMALITSVKQQFRDMPFVVACKRLSDALELGVSEAKALHTRRATDWRKLSDQHISAIDDVVTEAEAWIAELKALRTTDEAPSIPHSRGLGSTSARLELARRRLTFAGVLEHSS